MSEWKSIDDILNFAIEEEEKAAAFYTQLAEKATSDAMRRAFEGFAREEMGHKDKLEAVKAGGTLAPSQKPVMDLKIADYLVDVEPHPDMDYQRAITVAMKKEKAAFKLYSDLAAAALDESTRQVLLALAQEEAKHKLRFEIEYDDMMSEA